MQYNGCTWCGGILRVEEAKPSYLDRLRADWAAENAAAAKLSAERAKRDLLNLEAGVQPSPDKPRPLHVLRHDGRKVRKPRYLHRLCRAGRTYTNPDVSPGYAPVAGGTQTLTFPQVMPRVADRYAKSDLPGYARQVMPTDYSRQVLPTGYGRQQKGIQKAPKIDVQIAGKEEVDIGKDDNRDR